MSQEGSRRCWDESSEAFAPRGHAGPGHLASDQRGISDAEILKFWYVIYFVLFQPFAVQKVVVHVARSLLQASPISSKRNSLVKQHAAVKLVKLLK